LYGLELSNIPAWNAALNPFLLGVLLVWQSIYFGEHTSPVFSTLWHRVFRVFLDSLALSAFVYFAAMLIARPRDQVAASCRIMAALLRRRQQKQRLAMAAFFCEQNAQRSAALGVKFQTETEVSSAHHFSAVDVRRAVSGLFCQVDNSHNARSPAATPPLPCPPRDLDLGLDLGCVWPKSGESRAAEESARHTGRKI